MKRHGLTFIPTKKMSRAEWLSKRQEGLGGSDMGTIMNANKNFSRLELFYQKCGATKDSTEINPAMYWGNELEDLILRNAQYLDLDTNEYLANIEADNKLRDHKEFKYMVRNEKYPWLLANLDGLTNFDRKKWKAEGIAEIKSISRQSAEMWETYPIYHHLQVLMYIIVMEPMLTGESNIFYLKDGRELYGYHVPKSRDVMDTIIETSYDFWESVQAGREIVQNTPNKEKQLQFLSEIEPEATFNASYLDFVSKLYLMKKAYKTIEGTEDIYEHASAYSYYGKEITEMNKQRELHRCHIMNALRKDSANVISFGKGGKITYNKKLYVNIKQVAVEN